MKLVLVSPPEEDPREVDVVRRALDAGLARYHLRRPGASAEALERWLVALRPGERARVVLHGHPDLAARCGTGAHWADAPSSPRDPPADARPTSRACHRLADLPAALGRYDAVLVSPLFPSISKPGYGPSGPDHLRELARLLASRDEAARRTEVIGLGGVEAARIGLCREVGLDGVAVLGAVWREADPHRAVLRLLRACAALSTQPEARAASRILP